MKKYTIKKIISGRVIGLEGQYVAVPDMDYDRDISYNDGEPFIVSYKNETMIIRDWKKAATYRTFGDRLKRGTYRLGYFEWKGNTEKRSNKKPLKAETATFLERAITNLMIKNKVDTYLFDGTISDELQVELDKVLGTENNDNTHNK